MVLYFGVVLLLAEGTTDVVINGNGPAPGELPRKATDTQGKVNSGIAGATFAIYKEESGGSPLWLETQNIQADAKGNYTI